MNQDISEMSSEILSMLANANRIRILKRLQQGKTCNCDLITDLKIEQSNLSRHLKLLTQAGILIRTQEGTRVYYEIADKRILKIIELAENIAIRTVEKQSMMIKKMLA